MKNIKNTINVSIITLLAVLGMFAVQVSAKGINGFYRGDDGGAYFITQVDSQIYAVGERADGDYANVLKGTIIGTKIIAHWWDIPKGKAVGSGDIVFDIKDNGNTLTKISSSSPFLPKTLTLGPAAINVGGTRVSLEESILAFLRSKPEGYRGGPNNITGAWNGDDFATYYVREMPNGDVVWFAENNFWGDPGGEVRPKFARVFIGKKTGNAITGNYVDVSKGTEIGNAVMTAKIVGPQEITFGNPPAGRPDFGMRRSMPNNLRGYADLHTHPMVNLGFGGKLIHGAPDVGSIIPTDKDCNHNIRAKSIQHALGPATPTHGSPDQIPCGDAFRRAVIFAYEKANDALVTVGSEAQGAPSFAGYPKWNDIAHQKMWVDWIRRSYNAGQRVMVALATTNSTLTAAVSGPGDGPLDDKGSADLQITEIKSFVVRHNDFMEVALTSADLRRIVASNKMAVVLGVEIDNIGNFNKFPNFDLLPPATRASMINAEMVRLRVNGVRYIFPIHVLDNKFGGTAVYEDLFNYSNKREEGHWWKIKCSTTDESISHKFEPFLGDDIPKEAKDLLSGLTNLKVGLDVNAPKPPDCGKNGHKNGQGLQLKKGGTGDGEAAINQMMKLGMLIDIDHMSLASATDTLGLAVAVPGGYPLVSGHTGLRVYQQTENSRTEEQLEQIAKLGGMFGLGSADGKAYEWAAQYAIADSWISGREISGGKSPIFGEGRVSFGTDLNGLVKGPRPRLSFTKSDYLNNPLKVAQQIKTCSEILYKDGFVKSKTGDMTWNYCTDGVAHYGMMADFLADVRTEPNYGSEIYASMMKNAEMFAEMWEKAEKESKLVK